MAVFYQMRGETCLTDARKLFLPMAPGAGRVTAFPSLPSGRGRLHPHRDQLPFRCLRCSQVPRFSPQKEFPEILEGSNMSLALQLLHTILVRKFWIPKPTWDRGLIFAACPPGCGLGSSNTEGHSSTICSFPPCTQASRAGGWRAGPLSFLPFVFP